MQIFVHNFGNNIQSARRGISIEQNCKSDADDQYITEHVKFLAVGHGAKIRKNLFKKPQKQWKHNACIDSFCSEFPTARKESDNQKYYI